MISICTVQVNFNSLAQYSNTRAPQPGHWLGPVTWPGWLGLAQPMWAELGPAQKIYVGPGRAQPKK